MGSLVTKLSLVAALAAAAIFLTPGSGLPGAVGVASAAPFGLQAGQETDASMVTLAKKGGKGKHHHGLWGVGIVVGVGYCVARSEWCAERYGAYNHWYRRCMRRSGCD
jgi:hypothetical protein